MKSLFNRGVLYGRNWEQSSGAGRCLCSLCCCQGPRWCPAGSWRCVGAFCWLVPLNVEWLEGWGLVPASLPLLVVFDSLYVVCSANLLHFLNRGSGSWEGRGRTRAMSFPMDCIDQASVAQSRSKMGTDVRGMEEASTNLQVFFMHRNCLFKPQRKTKAHSTRGKKNKHRHRILTCKNSQRSLPRLLLVCNSCEVLRALSNAMQLPVCDKAWWMIWQNGMLTDIGVVNLRPRVFHRDQSRVFAKGILTALQYISWVSSNAWDSKSDGAWFNAA